MEGRIRGCALICNLSGKIDLVLRDDFGLLADGNPNRMFTSLLDQGSAGLALDMLMEAKKRSIAFDYRLNIATEGGLRSLYFLCVNFEDQLLVVGADNHTEAIEFSNHLHTINNEQSNFIRQLIKEKSNPRDRKDAETTELLDDLSKVNNELVNLQRELNRKNAELERLNDIKNRFIGMASHDLRNPLNIIQIYSEFLIDETGEFLSPDHQEYLKIINQSTHFMVGLVSDLLEYSAIEGGKIQLNMESVDIVTAIAGIVKLMRPIALRKDMTIRFINEKESIAVDADMFKIEQVVNNLLGNAIKFSYPATEIEVKLDSAGGFWELSVSNIGHGIKKEDSEKLFKPFQQIAMKGTGNEKGTGLGLFIVKQIVDNHKGKIWVESVPGKATTFFVRIPVKQ